MNYRKLPQVDTNISTRRSLLIVPCGRLMLVDWIRIIPEFPICTRVTLLFYNFRTVVFLTA